MMRGSVPVSVVVHDCTGSPGYPVFMLAMNDEYRELLVEHFRQGVQVGDQMIVGTDAITKRTYLVARNVPHPRKPVGWVAVLRLIPAGPVTVGGRTYCGGEAPQ